MPDPHVWIRHYGVMSYRSMMPAAADHQCNEFIFRDITDSFSGIPPYSQNSADDTYPQAPRSRPARCHCPL